MGRPRTPLGAHGSITSRRTNAGTWEARTRVRDADGRTRAVTRRATTRSKAEVALLEAIQDRVGAEAGRLTRSSSLEVVGQRWLAERRLDVMSGGLTHGSYDRYEHALVKHINPTLGMLSVGEITPGRIAAYLKATTRNFKLIRTVLSQVLGFAYIEGAIATNPALGIRTRHGRDRSPKPAMSLEDLLDVVAALDLWEAEPSTRESQRARRSIPLRNIFELLMGTGCRISEALALTWIDANLTTGQLQIGPTLEIRRAADGGLTRKPTPKSYAGARQVAVPPEVLAMLQRRRDTAGNVPAGTPIFASTSGGFISPTNVRTAWRDARAAYTESTGRNLDWIGPHSFRRTLGTHLVEDVGVEQASKILGHANTATTLAHYWDRRAGIVTATDTQRRLSTAWTNGAARSRST